MQTKGMIAAVLALAGWSWAAPPLRLEKDLGPTARPLEALAPRVAERLDPRRYVARVLGEFGLDLDGREVVWVSGPADLAGALRVQEPGQVIFLDPTAGPATFDLSLSLEPELNPIVLGDGVILLGDRGIDGALGALVYTTRMDHDPLIRVEGDDVAIAGLRLRGPDIWVQECRDCAPFSYGIRSDAGGSPLTIAHNELWGWSWAAILLDGTPGGPTDPPELRIRDNYIHHNRRDGLGYGVVIFDAFALIERNIFDNNRHAIAGGGDPGSGYEARHNVVLENHGGSHHFDMHAWGGHDCYGPASESVYIHHNTFQAINRAAFKIRSRSDGWTRVQENDVRHSKEECSTVFGYDGAAFCQDNPCNSQEYCEGKGVPDYWECEEHYGNFDVHSNRLDVYHKEYSLHDFDGDGSADLFLATGRAWILSRSGTNPWAHRRSSGVSSPDLAFGDFDGDGRTDVFRATGGPAGEWWVSLGAESEWQRLNASSQALDTIDFADFDGDGRTDVFRYTSGNPVGKWTVSWGGASPWEFLNDSRFGLGDIRFGDFDGDGRADVFRAPGAPDGTWWISRGGLGDWEPLNVSNVPLEDLAFGDFDGDGATDVFRHHQDEWLVSYSGSGPWEHLNHASFGIKGLHFADLDGNGKTDVFRVESESRFWVSGDGVDPWAHINESFCGEHHASLCHPEPNCNNQ